jgi:hypothetical protein
VVPRQEDHPKRLGHPGSEYAGRKHDDVAVQSDEPRGNESRQARGRNPSVIVMVVKVRGMGMGVLRWCMLMEMGMVTARRNLPGRVDVVMVAIAVAVGVIVD